MTKPSTPFTITRSNVSYRLRWHFINIGVILTMFLWIILTPIWRYLPDIVSTSLSIFWVFIWFYIEWKNRNKIVFLEDSIHIEGKVITISSEDYFQIEKAMCSIWYYDVNPHCVYSIYFISKQHESKFRLYSSVWKRKTLRLFEKIASIYNLKTVDKIKNGNIQKYWNHNVIPIVIEEDSEIIVN